ncbi:MAG: tRNA (adenosine(37)-N6)-threonylcarbamoyltransferase complex dimerization subunit type 1 TsaB [Candidatus Blackburnbacteria bacterium RIFCSPHIGHO2_01_FULL_44_64]|uniref:tRNA (Adenosine(37)-N6)-threonylcarbamoyltransferase complex dimerization subunit type 1 TsaB n=1 Tax=Candidatus Blackburnbacteria bacterium RIFCSPHIGHO2_02_FULL_44_20 TaxID=1797516 RepID=A0A1G1V937_9BACT|nr:MAG: tRNA (adenosine(37)-N6)-threonylcarbamoyltransferase complex dimerization subunit type 1 TsaB [Candidatus Blackburnbacteria bacterium RIFCSPHIGHO2_01_FULL_44_64]OGY11246.1 MAG: tRNA (adenosine(37)-N6)-threonylcarbamoyltransferase complex dimerization subunit type 1 TsaB [Candidatus Blackburnbacteria bacterium RIFCSPHIGHO2_12_FULL_44_25]OGY11935.1 MAG: tRNA (adenosine(37)-N6)-threonylcarbamoyltransferase complex dimerization subunit type 1 TsaB [Candidatus Blackburnbacteria bacterium RIFCS
MKLYIDTTNSEKIKIKVGDVTIKKESREKTSQTLLQTIEEALKKRKIKLKDLSEIEIEEGPGSFTGLRVGAAVANTLGFTLNIPVNGKMIPRDGPVEPKY